MMMMMMMMMMIYDSVQKDLEQEEEEQSCGTFGNKFRAGDVCVDSMQGWTEMSIQ